MADHPIFSTRDVVSDDARSVYSFETILPAYSEATVPSYTRASASSLPSRFNPPAATESSSRTRLSRPPHVPQPQILSISQSRSNLPLRFRGPQSRSSQNQSVYSASSAPKRRPGAELNIFSRNSKPSVDPVGHGDMSEVPFIVRRSTSTRPPVRHNFDEEIRMRELDELTRAISQANRNQQDYPRAIPQVAESQNREFQSLNDEWDNCAVEAQREEIILRISELENQFRQRGRSQSGNMGVNDSLRRDIKSLQAMLSARRDNVSEIQASCETRLREFRQTGTPVSHSQNNQMKNDASSIKAEIAFLEQRLVDLEKLARLVGQDDGRRPNEQYALEDDSKSWDLWLEASRNR